MNKFKITYKDMNDPVDADNDTLLSALRDSSDYKEYYTKHMSMANGAINLHNNILSNELSAHNQRISAMVIKQNEDSQENV